MQSEIPIEIPTEDKIQRDKTLEGIFLPHTRRRRNEIRGASNSQDLFGKYVHYTTAEAAINIIETKCFWMRNATCMSDFREVQHGFDLLFQFFSNPDKSKAFKDAVNASVMGAADDAIKFFDQWWNVIRLNTFIASFSEHSVDEDSHGRLSMWRAFGANTARVAIVFNVPPESKAARNMHLRFSPVSYLKNDESAKLIPEIIENISKNSDFLKSVDKQEVINWIFHMLLTIATCSKHEGFREEREWRIVRFPDIDRAPNFFKSSVEVVAGVPQLVYKLPLDKAMDPVLEDLDFARIFDRLIIGPTQYAPAMGAAFKDLLSKAGVVDANKKIFVSGIPIRS